MAVVLFCSGEMRMLVRVAVAVAVAVAAGAREGTVTGKEETRSTFCQPCFLL